jgi:hypothetical protein
MPHRPQRSDARLLIDLGDLYAALASDDHRGGHVLRDVQQALERLPEHAGRGLRVSICDARAYADYASLPGAEMFTLRALTTAGITPVFVDEHAQGNASELALTLDAAASAQAGDTVLIASGRRIYAPLVDLLRRRGCTVALYLVEFPADRKALHLGENGRIESFRDLIPDRAPSEPRPPRDVEHLAVTDAGSLRALEIIEEFFGQYEEIYLTPLLRKLTESDDQLDPKDAISDLEAAGAVYLEKRRGYPHDYTVLIVDKEHPDVIRVRDLFEDEDEDDAGDDDDYDYAYESDTQHD